MNASVIGTIIGAIAGFASYRTLTAVASKVDKPETKKLLGVVAAIELGLMPLLGFLIGRFVFGEA